MSTFRREPDPDEQESDEGELLITSDNTFGSPREDAFRRDFTVNALFYNIADFSVIDYVGGIDDLRARLVRAIGDPGVRFQEDPVRMLRACEFAGRLGFGIESATQEAIHEHRREIEKASPARLTEEMLQLLRCGQAGRVLQWLLDLSLLEVFLPEAYAMVAAGERGLGEFGRILPAIDAMVVNGGGAGLSDPALLAAVLLPSVLLRRHDVEAVDQRPMSRGALAAMVGEIVAPFFARFSLSREKAQHVERAIVGFLRMCEPGWSDGARAAFTRRPYFPDSLALFELLVRATDDGHQALAEWQRAAERRRGGAATEAEGAGAGSGTARRRPRRRRRRR